MSNNLIIPYPIPMPREHGVLSLESCGLPLSVRLHRDDLDVLRREAQHVDIKPSGLCRWFIVHGVASLALTRTGHKPVMRP